MSLTNQQIAEAGAVNLTSMLMPKFDGPVVNQVHRHGNPLARLIRPGEIVPLSHDAADEGGRTFRMRTGFGDTARAGLDLLADINAPRRSRSDKIRVRCNAVDSANNDVHRIETAGRLNFFDMKRAGESPDEAAEIAQQHIEDAVSGYDTTIEVLMNVAKDAVIGLVNGTKKNNDAPDYGTATTYTSGSTSARFKVDNGSIGLYRENMHITVRNPSGDALRADELRITDVNYEDFSIGVTTTDRTAASVDNLNGIADNDEIYRSGEEDSGFKGGFGEIFKTSYASDSWFGGVDRNSADKRHFIPIRTRISASTSHMSESIMNTLARAVGYKAGGDGVEQRYSIVMGQVAVDDWRRDEAAGTTKNRPAVGGDRIQSGELGLVYAHPILGKVNIVATQTAPDDRAVLFYPPDYQMLFGGLRGTHVLTGSTTAGMWERTPGNNTHGGGSMYYRYEGVKFCTPFPQNINRMAVAFNIG